MMTLAQVATWTGGTLLGGDCLLNGVSTDTRTLQPGELFVALRGERFDGHSMLAAARAAGARAVLVEQEQTEFEHAVWVSDSRQGLGRLAAGWAAQFAPPTVAVTGNAGKTTVKEMIACMLGDDTLATQGNLNNDIGVPLTLLRMGPRHRAAVIELGASGPGEIAWTSALVRPQVALITNVTGAHLAGFGSMDGIAAAKAEIFSGMAAGGHAVINLDDGYADRFSRAAQDAGLHCSTVSVSDAAADFYASDVNVDEQGVAFVLHHQGDALPVQLPLQGAHQVSNALMAAAAVVALDRPLAAALARLRQLAPVPGRVQRQRCLGGTLIDDSYNANPGSVRAAMALLMQCPAPRALVLGAIGELGEQSDALHRALGEDARALGIDQCIAVHPGARPVAAGFGGTAVATDQHQQAADLAAAVLRDGGSVLVKGSRSARMDVVTALLQGMGETR